MQAAVGGGVGVGGCGDLAGAGVARLVHDRVADALPDVVLADAEFLAQRQPRAGEQGLRVTSLPCILPTP